MATCPPPDTPLLLNFKTTTLADAEISRQLSVGNSNHVIKLICKGVDKFSSGFFKGA